ncbi:MAG: hypothetical protein LM580_08735 [Thermofilum sp.]|nr:hypothetical protein [Thermofilum sp.]
MADRPALLYIVRAPVLKVEVAGQKMFFAAVGEVSSRLELYKLARDHLSLLERSEVEVAAEKPARLYDLLGNRLPSRAELRFAWFGFEIETPKPERHVPVRFKVVLRDGVWRRRRTVRAETAMEAFAAEALIRHDLSRGVRRARFSSAKLGRWVPTLVAHLGPFYNFDALREMPAEPPARFKVRAPRRSDADLRSLL